MTKWGLQAVRTIADVALGPHDFISSSNIDQLKGAWNKRTHEHAVFYCEVPDTALVELFMRSDAPFIVFADDPREVTAYAMIERKEQFVQAARSTSRVFAVLHNLMVKQDAFLISRSSISVNVHTAVGEIVTFFQLKLDQDAIVMITSRLVNEIPSSHEEAIRTLARHLDSGEKIFEDAMRGAEHHQCTFVQAAIEPLRDLAIGKPITTVTWPRSVFLSSDEKGSALSGPIDLTGRARQLTYGPYLHLPTGKWNATFFMNAIQCFSQSQLHIDVFSGTNQFLARGRCDFRGEGFFRVELPFEVKNPASPLEARIALERGAIEGRLDVLRVTLSRDRADPFFGPDVI